MAVNSPEFHENPVMGGRNWDKDGILNIEAEGENEDDKGGQKQNSKEENRSRIIGRDIIRYRTLGR